MKKILLTAIATLFVAGIYAQSSTPKMDDKKMENSKMDDSKMENSKMDDSKMGNSKMKNGKMNDQKMKIKEGVMMMDNKVMMCNQNKCTPLTKTYNCSDGCKVSTDGTVTKADGSTMKMMNGSMINKEGKVTMIPHGEKGHMCSENCPMHSKM